MTVHCTDVCNCYEFMKYGIGNRWKTETTQNLPVVLMDSGRTRKRKEVLSRSCKTGETRNVWRYHYPTEAVNRRTDNTMAKRKRTKGEKIIKKKLHRKLKIEQ